MVWQTKGRYGIHTGRTLRKPSNRISSKDRGFLIKIVLNTAMNFSDQDVNRCLKKFQIADGFNDEEVVEESRNHRHWGFGGGGFSDNSILYSVGKRKRWLVPSILSEEIPEDYDSENDYKVVLVERVSGNDSSWFSRSPRLKHGDCKAVLDGADVRKPKRRKFAHVGDLRNESNKTEIMYEVNHTESSTSWPSYVQHDWRESRDQKKARCKVKGKKNKRRVWGGYKKFELDKQPCENYQQETLFDHKTGIGKGKVLVVNSDEHEYKRCSVLDQNDFVFPKFDIGNYILESLTSSGQQNAQKHTKVSVHDERKLTTVNPASSQPVNLHGKGSAVYIDPVNAELGYHDNKDNKDSPQTSVTAHLITKISAPVKAVSQNVDIEREKVDSRVLSEQFGEIYKEAASLPRRFCICPSNQESKFVFTVQTDSVKHKNNGTERVPVAIVSDQLPPRKLQDLKEFLHNSFGACKQESKEEKQRSGAMPDCSSNSGIKCQSRMAVMSYDLLCDINRWSYKASLPSLAMSDNLPCNSAHYRDTVSTGGSNITSIPDDILCEICCCERYQDSTDGISPAVLPFTAMKSCMHWFCNDCWKCYLSSEVQQGKTIIKCPGHDCDTPVDDVTIMALLPDSFPKFLRMRQEKAVEMNAALKWCPGNKCNLVVKATVHSVAKETDRVLSVPIRCNCGHNWCFACQEEPHWPASCAEAAFFRSQTESYEKIVRAKAGGITSVNVKRCPHCSYPIEKNQGCPHMMCAMCKGEFCWECLENWASHKWGSDCSKKSKQEEEVELINDIGSTRFNAHLRVAIANRIARAGPVMFKKYSVVKKLEEVLKVHDGFTESGRRAIGLTSTSCMLLNQYNSHEVPKYLKASADFKFQSHFVIEGMSILMAVSKTKYCHVKLKRLIVTLLFVVDRLEYMANSRQVCTDADKVNFQRLLNAGKNCIDCIRKLCVKVHHN